MNYSSYIIDSSTLTSMANTIRSKTSQAFSMSPQQMLDEIEWLDGETPLYSTLLPAIPSYQHDRDETILVCSDPSVRYVGDGAYRYCSNLSMISLPSCSFVGKDAFLGCSSLSKIDLPACVSLGQSTFAYCSFSSVIMPKLKYIGALAFYLCSASSEMFVSAPEVIRVEQSAFANYKGLYDINLPKCKIIEHLAFQGCSQLSSISIPMCKEVWRNAFTSTDLRSIALPACTFIDSFAFAYCSKMSFVDLQVGSYINSCAFLGCSSLSLILIRSATYIGSNAFQSCASLSRLYIKYSTTGPLNDVCTLASSNAFVDTLITSSKGLIYIVGANASVVSAYKAARGWSYFASRIRSSSMFSFG